MLELSAKTNLLEENDYRYSLQDVKDPVLYRDVYNVSPFQSLTCVGHLGIASIV